MTISQMHSSLGRQLPKQIAHSCVALLAFDGLMGGEVEVDEFALIGQDEDTSRVGGVL